MMPFERFQQRGQHRSEELAAQVIARGPDALQHRQQLAAVAAWPPSRSRRSTWRVAQPPDGGLAMTMRHATVLIEDPPLAGLVGLLVARLQIGRASCREGV